MTQQHEEEVWVEIGRDVALPREHEGKEIESIRLVRWVTPAGSDLAIANMDIKVSTSGYADPYRDGWLEFEFLYHKRAHRFYVDSKGCFGKFCFLVRFRKESTVAKEEGIVDGNV